MPNIEILAYCPNNTMAEFRKFVVKGGERQRGDTRERSGVFKWLYSRRVLAAHFFTSASEDNIQVFGATVTQNDAVEDDPVPWLPRQMLGFDEIVDGELKHGTSPPWQTKVSSDAELDRLFIAGKQDADKIFRALEGPDRSGLTFTTEDFISALRGNRKPGLDSMLAEAGEKLSFSPFVKLTLAEKKVRG